MVLTSRPGLLINLIIWLAITGFGAYFLTHIERFLNFGIDLVGGTYLTLDVKLDEAYKHELMSISDDFATKLKKQKLAIPRPARVSGTQATLEFENEKDAKEAYKFLKEFAGESRRTEKEYDLNLKGKDINVALSSSFLNDLRKDAIESNISILRTRMDVCGLAEITIYPQGEKNIVVELPSVSDPDKAKERIGKSALLEMKPIYDQASTKEKLLEKLNGEIPEGSMIISGKGEEKGYYLVPNYAKVTGRLLKDAYYLFSPPQFMEEPRSPHTVHFQFNPEGQELFYELTKDNVGGAIAIIIDNVVVSAASVKKPIEPSNSSIYISSSPQGMPEESAKELATLLKSGAYAAPVEIIEERQIGPSLGAESIKKGLMSCLIGMLLLLIFSLFIYKIPGLFAFIVLLYNLLLILLGLAYFPNATLTLPGIAGMVLTVGMAIDSSILIYERIKEELAAGASLRSAVDSGFNGALSVILDANITTFIVGAVLYYFGSPAIQGFALTMMIGIISTLITGLILLKWLFNFSLDILGFKRLSF